MAHPSNWRKHPVRQRKALKGSLDSLGWVAPVLENRRTGYLIDGHERVWQALQNGDAPVPYIVVDLDESEEAQALLSLDAIAALAQTDVGKVGELLRMVDSSNADVQEFLSSYFDVAEQPAINETPEDAPVMEDVPDALFPSDNEWDIPTLDMNLQATTLALPVNKWGVAGRKAMRNVGGTIHFYTDDYKFNGLWASPEDVANTGCFNIIEPNYSTNVQMPRAVVMWATYRKRWMARLWQSVGIRVFVDLNVEPQFQDINLIGVPTGWKAYATRALESGNGLDVIVQHYEQAKTQCGNEPIFVVIGGNEPTRQLCQQRGWAWVPEYSTMITGAKHG